MSLEFKNMLEDFQKLRFFEIDGKRIFENLHIPIQETEEDSSLNIEDENNKPL